MPAASDHDDHVLDPRSSNINANINAGPTCSTSKRGKGTQKKLVALWILMHVCSTITSYGTLGYTATFCCGTLEDSRLLHTHVYANYVALI